MPRATSKLTNLCDPSTGARLLTVEETAKHLNYHPVSIRRLVSQGILRPRTRAGKTLLFYSQELERFKYKSQWAARKARVRFHSNPPPPLDPPKRLKALVTVEVRGRPKVSERIRVFRWEDIPLIRARVENKFGNVRIQISIEGPDSSGWEVSYYPSSRELKRYGELNRSKRGSKELWLAG